LHRHPHEASPNLRALVSGGARKEEAAMVKGRTGQRVRLYVRGTILGFKR
jgi:hypothetical protein